MSDASVKPVSSTVFLKLYRAWKQGRGPLGQLAHVWHQWHDAATYALGWSQTNPVADVAPMSGGSLEALGSLLQLIGETLEHTLIEPRPARSLRRSRTVF